MTPKRVLGELAGLAVLYRMGVGAIRSGGAQAYVAAGNPIPDQLLPGRVIERCNARDRAALRELTSDAARDVPDWVARRLL